MLPISSNQEPDFKSHLSASYYRVCHGALHSLARATVVLSMYTCVMSFLSEGPLLRGRAPGNSYDECVCACCIKK